MVAWAASHMDAMNSRRVAEAEVVTNKSRQINCLQTTNNLLLFFYFFTFLSFFLSVKKRLLSPVSWPCQNRLGKAVQSPITRICSLAALKFW